MLRLVQLWKRLIMEKRSDDRYESRLFSNINNIVLPNSLPMAISISRKFERKMYRVGILDSINKSENCDTQAPFENTNSKYLDFGGKKKPTSYALD